MKLNDFQNLKIGSVVWKTATDSGSAGVNQTGQYLITGVNDYSFILMYFKYYEGEDPIEIIEEECVSGASVLEDYEFVPKDEDNIYCSRAFKDKILDRFNTLIKIVDSIDEVKPHHGAYDPQRRVCA